jgi:hypothetical protein
MSVKAIKEFSEKAKANPELGEKLKAAVKMKELRALFEENGLEYHEDSFYPPNEPQFVEEQLSEKMAKALLRV